jgi:hypothetical protein
MNEMTPGFGTKPDRSRGDQISTQELQEVDQPMDHMDHMDIIWIMWIYYDLLVVFLSQKE